ncbi:MAG: PucR family transcriptional regulator [Comamonadaceae bacterium]|nr:MAG: PucR family transcriptional regulator [Comamonadaceae bacterium]
MILDEIATEVSERLAASVVLVDNAFSLVTYSAQAPGVDTARVQSILMRSCSPGAREWYEQFGIADSTTPVRTPENLEIGAAPRICLPARYAGTAYGYLFVLPDKDSAVSDADLTAVMHLAEQAGQRLAHSLHDNYRLAVAVADLLEGEREASARALDRIENSGLFPNGTSVVVLAVDGLTPRPGSRTLLAPIGSLTAVMVPITDSVGDPVRAITDNTTLAGALVGVGETYRDIRAAARSWQQAKVAVRVAHYDRSIGPVAYWTSLGIYRLAAYSPSSGVADAVLTPSVRALLDHRSPDLLVTAQVYLSHAGDTAAAASELGIHRQTLYYRIAKIEEIAGLDLSIGMQRLELHVGITLGHFLYTQTRADR